MNEAISLPVAPKSKPAFKDAVLGALLGGALAGVANLALYGVARAAGVDFIANFQSPDVPSALPIPMVAVASLVPALVGGVVLGVLRALASSKARTIFVGLAAVFGLLSLGGPLGLAGASLATKISLALMHVVVAVAIVTMALRRTR